MLGTSPVYKMENGPFCALFYFLEIPVQIVFCLFEFVQNEIGVTETAGEMLIPSRSLEFAGLQVCFLPYRSRVHPHSLRPRTSFRQLHK